MEYNKKTQTGWIDDQYCLKGNFIELIEGTYTIYLEKNGVSIHLTHNQMVMLKQMIKEFDKKHIIK